VQLLFFDGRKTSGYQLAFGHSWLLWVSDSRVGMWGEKLFPALIYVQDGERTLASAWSTVSPDIESIADVN
jgi:hypothetical protein